MCVCVCVCVCKYIYTRPLSVCRETIPVYFGLNSNSPRVYFQYLGLIPVPISGPTPMNPVSVSSTSVHSASGSPKATRLFGELNSSG